MQRLLFRRTLRQLKANLFRYLALFFLIVLAMGIVIGVVGSAKSVIRTVDQKAQANALEDGQFALFVPLTDPQQTDIKDMGIILEPCFSLDFAMPDGSTLRLMKNRESINRIELATGRLAGAEDEIVLERLYASAHSLSVGDSVHVAEQEFTVCGLGTTADYDLCLQNMSDMSADGGVFGTAFVTGAAYERLLALDMALHTEEYRYSYRLGAGATDAQLKDYLAALTVSPDAVHDAFFQELVARQMRERDAMIADVVDCIAGSMLPAADAAALREKATRVLDEYAPFAVDNLTDFVRTTDNPRIKAANRDVEINIRVGLMAGVLVMVLIAYVISVFTVHSIDQESAMIGALYALGLKRRQLMLHYAMLPVALCLSGGLVGTVLGYSRPMLQQMAGESFDYFSVPAIQAYHNPLLMLYGILLPPVSAFLVSWLILRRRLNRTALSLLRKELAAKKAAGARLSSLRFPRAFQLRQLLREKRSCFAVLAGIFLSLMILILGLNCYVLCRNIEVQTVEDTKYDYLYQFKYPESAVPAGGHAAYVKELKKENLGYDMTVSIIGLERGNPFFPAISSEGKHAVSISSSVASKFRLQPGDELLLCDDLAETAYVFTVTEIVPYAPGLCVFMEISAMRERFAQEDGYYNAVYADHALDIDAGRLYAVATKADVEKSASIFRKTMTPLVMTMTGSAILIFLIVLYQMTKVMIDRASISISLMKVFGYRNREIRRLYLDGSFRVVALGTLLLLPLAKRFMDAIYPSFVANVACGTDFSWPPVLYAATYVGSLFCYLIIRTILMGRLKRLTPAEVLKERE